MTDWIIIHNLKNYVEHPDHIGLMTHKKPWWLEQMACGDRIVYYVKGEKYVMDLGVITSEAQYWEDDKFWPGTWVRSFRSYFPNQKGVLLTIDELRKVSKTAAQKIGKFRLPSAMKLEPGEFDRILDYVRQKLLH